MGLARVGAAGREIPVAGNPQSRRYDLSSLVETMDAAVFSRTAEIAVALAAGELPAVEEPVRSVVSGTRDPAQVDEAVARLDTAIPEQLWQELDA
jgi:aryl-alcohol dehydrogenase-like predicted oxidoreductase